MDPLIKDRESKKSHTTQRANTYSRDGKRKKEREIQAHTLLHGAVAECHLFPLQALEGPSLSLSF